MEPTGTPAANALPETHPGTWMRFFGAAWYPTAGLAVAILLGSIPGYLSGSVLGVFEGRMVVGQDFTSRALLDLTIILSMASGWVSVLLAGGLYLKKRGDRIGLFLAYFLLAHGVIFGGSFELLSWFWPAAPWVNSFILLPIFSGPLTMALFGIFPDGRFVPRWSIWLIPFSMLGILLALFQLGFMDTPEGPLQFNFYQIMTGIFSVIMLFGSIYAQVYRYRRISTPRQRRQTRWVLYGLVLWFAVIGFSSIPWSQALALPDGSTMPRSVLLGAMGWTVSSFFLPVTLTIAVLRDGLLEIDLLINRTLVYGLLSAMLGGIYFVSVLVLENAFRSFSGQESPLAIVVSTLVIAALFVPLRTRVQTFINRRFYRDKYDAQQTLAHFAGLARSEVNVSALSVAILQAVEETMHPSQASLWLRR
jgi:hypothetical protein